MQLDEEIYTKQNYNKNYNKNSIIFSYCSTYNNLQKRTSISVKFNDMKYQKFIKINLLWTNHFK